MNVDSFSYKHIQLVLLFFFIIISTDSISQDSLIVYSLDEITVLDNRSVDAIPNLLQSKSSIRLTPAQKLNSKHALKYVSKTTPGVFVSGRTNSGYGIGPNSGGNIFVRGIGTSPNTQVLMLVNGNPQYMGLMGHPLPDSYSSDEVMEVQVLNGPASAIYGSGAMGGVINIITDTKYAEGITGSVSSGYGSFNSLKYAGKISYGVNQFSASFNYRKEKTDGHRNNSDFDIDSYSLDLNKRLNKNFYFRIHSSLDNYSIADPGSINDTLSGSVADISRGVVEVSIGNHFENTDGRISLFHNFGEHSISDGFNSSDFNYGGRIFQNLELSNSNTTTAGFDFSSFGGEAENYVFDNYFGDHSISQYGFYLSSIQSINELIKLNAALRYDYNSQFGGIATPQAGFRIEFNKQSHWKVLVSKGYRNPTIRELYLFPFPTPNLQPEELWNYETGFTYSPGSKLIFKMNLYYIEGDNLIQVTGMPPNLVYSNSGKFINKGIEGAINYRSDSFYGADLMFTIIDPDKVTASFPLQSVSLFINFSLADFYATLSLDHNSEIYGSNNYRDRLDNFTLLGFAASFNPLERLELGVEIENILDEEYQVLIGYPMPGISINGNLKYNFDLK